MVATPQRNTEVEVIDIPLDEIRVSKRLRSVSEEKVEALADSIRLLGLLHPICVSKRKDGYLLLSGNHRVSAYRLLNRKTIPATLHLSDDMIGKLVEISENLIRSSISELQISSHILLREELLTKLGKRSASGDNRWNRTGVTNEELARSMGLEKRTYQRKKSIAKNMHPDVMDWLEETEWATSAMDMLALSKENHDVQLEVAKLLITGKCKGFKRALTLARIKCISFDWNAEQTRVKELVGRPYSVMKWNGDSSPLSKLCKLVSHDEDCQVIKKTWGTESCPNYSQHPDHAAHFINFYSKEGDVVADVMCGRGVNVLVGAALGRKMIGYDLSEQNLKTIRSTVLEHTNAKASDLTLHHSDGAVLKEYEGQENIWDLVTFDPPFVTFGSHEKYGDDSRDLAHAKDLDAYLCKMETCLKNLKRLVKPSSFSEKIFHPIVIKVGSGRHTKHGLIDLATEIEIIARKLNLIIHDKVINVLDSQWAMFNISRCIDNRYSVKIHETNIVMVKY